MSEPIKTYEGNFFANDHYVKSVDLVEIDDGLYDLYDNETGECLNEGCPFPFIPTENELREFIQTTKIKGKIE